MKEIIKLRAIYEPNPYYSCLVKAPLFLNAYMILFAPFFVNFKSNYWTSHTFYEAFYRSNFICARIMSGRHLNLYPRNHFVIASKDN